jgi:hypothetical protein
MGERRWYRFGPRRLPGKPTRPPPCWHTAPIVCPIFPWRATRRGTWEARQLRLGKNSSTRRLQVLGRNKTSPRRR